MLRVKTILLISCCMGSLLLPQQTRADDDTPPSLEFLEFLADWESDQGEWIDPLQMQQLEKDEHTEVQAND